MARHTQTIIFIALVALVALRPLVSETYDYRTDSISLALTDIANPTPVLTLGFVLVILLCGVAWLITRAIGTPTPYRRTGLEWGSVVLAVAAVVSCVAAGQQRVAITASLDWLCLPILAITLTQLMQTHLHRRVLLAAVLASACVQTFHGFEQYFVGFDETWSAYQAGKADFWASQGVAIDSTKVELFERRILAREASGTFSHSNVAGSYLVLCGITALGLAISTWRNRNEDASSLKLLCKIGSGIGAAAILATVWLTGSLGAILTGGVAIAGLLLAWRFRPKIDRHRRKLFALGWSAFLLGCVATIGHGIYHGSLPGSSLNFRWQYWVNATGMIADHPLAGVGRENFGNHYLAYKSIESPEEISNPHNLFVQAASEWGFLGLAGVVMVAFGLSRALTRTTRYSPRNDDPDSIIPNTDCGYGPATAAGSLLIAGMVVVIGRLALCGSSQDAYLYYTGVVTVLAWGTGAAVFYCGAFSRKTSSGTNDLTGTAAAFGVLAFAIHELANFAIFVPGTATTLFALIAMRCAEAPCVNAQQITPNRTRAQRLAAPFVGVIVVVCVYVVAIRPPLRSDRLLQQADAQTFQLPGASLRDQSGYQLYESAALADPLDPYPFRKLVGWLRRASTNPKWQTEALTLAEAALASEIERDPFNASLRRQQMRFYLERAAQNHDDRDLQKAVESAVSALALYPLHPQSITNVADCRSAAGQATNNVRLLTQALDGYRKALALDNRRLEWERLHRLTEAQTATLREKIRKLEQTLAKRER